jgi:beta-1,4-mannooligosaccharide/beta-1,4-mannosyl-N-acetylglucosamine phosphorylase
MNIHAGRSKDGINWTIDDEVIEFIKTDPGLPDSEYKYDPRVVFVEDRWYIIWCNGYHGPCIGLGYTFDFEKFYQMENPLMFFNRNGVLFPRKIGKNYAMLSRPSDSGHTPFGDIVYSESPDLTFWGRHRHVMAPLGSESAWQSTKIGAGPAPIETAEGWLLFYHGVLTSCNGFVYSFGAALLDIDEPWKVIARSRPYLINPREPYECVGDVPNVTFPCACLVDGDTGRLAIYYGCADTVTGLIFGTVEEVVDFVKSNAV